MAYIGSSASPLPVNFAAVQAQSFNGTGSQTAFTLSRTVPSAASIEVLVNNVQQSPYDGSYSVSGTTLTFSEAPSSGTNNVYVVYRDQSLGSLVDATAYRRAEADALLNAKQNSLGYTPVNKAGDTMTGDLGVGATPLARMHATKAGVEVARFTNSQSNGGDWEFKIGGGGFENRKFMITDKFGGADNVRFSIDSGGRIQAQAQPSFRVATNSATAGADIVWNSVFHNIGNHYNNSNGRFTAPVSGTYQFQTHLLRPNSYGADMDIQIWLNGGGFATTVRAPLVAGVYTGATNSIAVYLNAGDYVTVRVTNTAPYLDTSWDYWSGYLVG